MKSQFCHFPDGHPERIPPRLRALVSPSVHGENGSPAPPRHACPGGYCQLEAQSRREAAGASQPFPLGGCWGPNESACGLPRAREPVLVTSTTTRSLVQLKTAFRENVRNYFEKRSKNWGWILSHCKSAARGHSSEGGGAPLLCCFSRRPTPRTRTHACTHTTSTPSPLWC